MQDWQRIHGHSQKRLIMMMMCVGGGGGGTGHSSKAWGLATQLDFLLLCFALRMI